MNTETRLNRIERSVGNVASRQVDERQAAFISAYYAAACCPTTASMLTGMPADTINLPNVREASAKFARRLMTVVNGKTRSVEVAPR